MTREDCRLYLDDEKHLLSSTDLRGSGARPQALALHAKVKGPGPFAACVASPNPVAGSARGRALPPPPASPCQGGVSLTGGGIIDFTGGYENGQDCRWILSCPGTMTLDFLTFQTEGNFVSPLSLRRAARTAR